MSAPHEEAAERLREFAEEWSQQVARAQHDPNTIHGMAPRGRAVSLDRTDLRLVLDEYAERGRKAAAFDALVEAVEEVAERAESCERTPVRVETALRSALEAAKKATEGE